MRWVRYCQCSRLMENGFRVVGWRVRDVYEGDVDRQDQGWLMSYCLGIGIVQSSSTPSRAPAFFVSGRLGLWKDQSWPLRNHR